MLRAIGAVIAGYAVIFIFIFAAFTGAFLAMGTERTFQPGSFDVSMLWVAVSVVLGIVAALLGGVVCAKIAPRGSRAPVGLAVLVLVLGGLVAVGHVAAPEPEDGPTVRTGDLSNTEAMMAAQSPLWFDIVNPLIGFVGVLVGGRLAGGGRGAREG